MYSWSLRVFVFFVFFFFGSSLYYFLFENFLWFICTFEKHNFFSPVSIGPSTDVKAFRVKHLTSNAYFARLSAYDICNEFFWNLVWKRVEWLPSFMQSTSRSFQCIRNRNKMWFIYYRYPRHFYKFATYKRKVMSFLTVCYLRIRIHLLHISVNVILILFSCCPKLS